MKLPGAGATPVPDAPFILGPDEKLETLVVAERATVEEARAAIAAARAKTPEAVLIIRLEGELVVGADPLRLSSRANLYFAPGAKMTATAGVSAMILVEDAELVGIAGQGDGRRGVIDGRGLAKTGIMVTKSCKVNLSSLEIRDCAGDAVHYEGKGMERYGEPGSLTGSRVTGNGGNGLFVRGSAQFMCYNNAFIDSRRAGIDVISPLCVIADNSLDGNQIGIFFGGNDSVVARNSARDCKIGIKMGGDSRLNMVTYNRVEGNGVGLHIQGESNAVYHNDLAANGKTVDFGSREHSSTLKPPSQNIFASNWNLSLADFQFASDADAGDVRVPPSIANNIYFDPPTRTNPHTNGIVAGMGRQDTEIVAGPGKKNVDDRPRWRGRPEKVLRELEKRQAMDLSEVQARIDEARKQKPKDYLVVHLYGIFVATKGKAGLIIPDYVSVVLHGNTSLMARFTEENAKTFTRPAVVSLDGHFFNSISGGYIDGGVHTRELRGIEVPGEAISIIDGVTVASADHGITMFGLCGTEARKKSYSMRRGRPVFIRGNTITNCSNMGLWGHMRQDALYIDNVATDNWAGGILHDSYNNHSPALFNVSVSNMRCGLWLELGARDNILYGNLLRTNVGRHSTGVVSYHGFKGRNRNNVVASNVIEAHRIGIHLRHAASNVVFGNVLQNNHRGYVNDHSHTADQGNYVAQNVLRYNRGDDVRGAEPAGFFAFPNKTVMGREQAAAAKQE